MSTDTKQQQSPSSLCDDALFELAIKQAKLALEEKEVPIGCVFYRTDTKSVIAQSRNSVNATRNATRHAELNCIDQVVDYCSKQNLKQYDLYPNIDVYVTCEPCIMCARILRHLQVGRVIYGCSNDRFGGCRSVIDVANSNKITLDPQMKYIHGVKEDVTIDLLRIFYSGENLNAPEEIRKVKRPKFNTDKKPVDG